MKIISNFTDGESKFSIHDLTIEELDNIRKSLYYTGWYNNMSTFDIVKSVQSTYLDIVKAIDNRTQYINGILTDANIKISKP